MWSDNNEIPVVYNCVWKFRPFSVATILAGFNEICSDLMALPPPEKDKSLLVMGMELRGYCDCIQHIEIMQQARINLHIFVALLPVHLF